MKVWQHWSWVLLSCAWLGAQPSIHALSWQQAVLQAWGKNPSLQIQQVDIRLQQLQSRRFFISFLPVFQYQNTNIRNIELPEFVFKIGNIEQRFRVGTPYNITHSLQINWTLFAGGSRWWGWRAQHHFLKATRHNLTAQTAQTALNVLNAYFSVLLSQEVVEFYAQMVQVAREHLHQTRLFVNQGTATPLDSLRAHSQFLAVLPELQAAQHQQLLALENLKALLNLSPSDSLVLTDSLHQLGVLPPTLPLHRDSLRHIALQNRPELNAIEESHIGWKNQVRATYGKFSPTIVVSASVDHQAQVDTFFPNSTDFTRVKRALITVQFPLFEGARRIIDIQEARAQQHKVQLQGDLLRRQILLEVDQSFLNFQEAQKKLPALKESWKQARETFRQARLLFAEGMATELEVMNAQTQLKQATLQWKQGLFEYIMAQFKLLKAIGLLNKIFE